MRMIRVRRFGPSMRYLEGKVKLSGLTYPQGIEFLEKIMEENPQSINLILAIEGEELLGFAVAFAPIGGEDVILGQLWEKETKLGIAKQLLDFIQKWTDTSERKEITVNLNSNDPQLKMFSGFGFKIKSVVMRLGLELEDEVLSESLVEAQNVKPSPIEEGVQTEVGGKAGVGEVDGKEGRTKGGEGDKGDVGEGASSSVLPVSGG